MLSNSNYQSPITSYQSSTVSDFIALLKPGVMSLVVFTGLCGMWLAPGHLHPLQQLIALLCIALGSGAGAAVNMWHDRDIDAIMRRTLKRPIPAGRVAPDDALALGLFLAALAVMLMGLALNWLAAGILAFAIFFYAVIYTIGLKRRTPQNIVIGGAAGAFPPMIGWAAVTGDISAHPIMLFMIIFLWTPPHFWALALYKNEDYAKAGVPMMPVALGAAVTKLHMKVYAWLLAAASLAPAAMGFSGNFYAAAALALNAGFLYHVHRVARDEGERWPRKTFAFSIFYLFMLYTAMAVDSVIPAAALSI